MMRSFLCLGVMLFVGLPSAQAQGESGNVCVRDYRAGAICTANDVRLEDLVVVSVAEDCLAGVYGEAEVVFDALLSSDGSPDRYDIGYFLATDGTSARDGDSCYHDYLAPALTATPTYGDRNSDTVPDINLGPFWNGDTDGDQCGDIESNTQAFVRLPALRFACNDSNGDNSVDISVCTSWDNNTNTSCNSAVDAFPGTNAKCSCGTVELGIAAPPALDGSIADGSIADGSIADGSIADGSIADGSIADGSIADGSIADGSIADGSTADGSIPDAMVTDSAVGRDASAEADSALGSDGSSKPMAGEGRLTGGSCRVVRTTPSDAAFMALLVLALFRLRPLTVRARTRRG